MLGREWNRIAGHHLPGYSTRTAAARLTAGSPGNCKVHQHAQDGDQHTGRPKGAHLIRYYGWYSNKARGMQRKVAEAAAVPEMDWESQTPVSDVPWEVDGPRDR